MFKTATIFVFLFLLSCTVTKRVHRPGFHIEWKKNYKVQSESKGNKRASRGAEKRDLKIDVSTPQDIQVAEGGDTTNIGQSLNESAEKEVVREEKAKTKREKKPLKSINFKQEARSFFVEKSRKYMPLKMPKKKKDVPLDTFDGEGFLYVGYILLGIGGYLLIGALLSYFGFWIMEELFYSLVFSGNGIIAGIFGFILFLIILLFVIIAYAIVHYLLGGAYVGFIVSLVFIGAGLLCLLIYASL